MNYFCVFIRLRYSSKLSRLLVGSDFKFTGSFFTEFSAGCSLNFNTNALKSELYPSITSILSASSFVAVANFSVMPTTPHEMENNTATVKTLIETHTKEHHFTKEEVTSMLEQSVVGMTEKFATATKELADKIEVMEGYNSDLSALVLKFSEQPAETSVKKLPVNLKSEPTNKRESLEEYRKRMNTQK